MENGPSDAPLATLADGAGVEDTLDFSQRQGAIVNSQLVDGPVEIIAKWRVGADLEHFRVRDQLGDPGTLRDKGSIHVELRGCLVHGDCDVVEGAGLESGA